MSQMTSNCRESLKPVGGTLTSKSMFQISQCLRKPEKVNNWERNRRGKDRRGRKKITREHEREEKKNYR